MHDRSHACAGATPRHAPKLGADACARAAVQVRHHDTVLAAGSGCVTTIRAVPRSHRVCCLELFGSVSVFEARWRWGGPAAALVPLCMHRESGWTRACVPLSADTIAAAMHDQYLAVLRTEDHGPDEHYMLPNRTTGALPPRAVSAAHACTSMHEHLGNVIVLLRAPAGCG